MKKALLMFRVFVALVFLGLLTVQPCVAEIGLKEEIRTFFHPLNASVVMQVGEEVVIDKGINNQVSPGDLFTGVREEKEILDPRSGKVIDTLKKYGPYLEVRRVTADYSFCMVLGDLESLSPGMTVSRFENVPVLFEDQSRTGFGVYSALRRELPNLRWEGYRTGAEEGAVLEPPGLLVRLLPGRVVILNHEGDIIFYQQEGDGEKQTDLSNPPSLDEGAKQIAIQTNQWVATRISLPEEEEIEALDAADLNGDGRTEVLLAVGRHILVGSLETNKFVKLFQSQPLEDVRIVNISVLDLDRKGGPEVAVSGLQDGQFKCWVFRVGDGELRLAATGNLLCSTFIPNDEEPILIGQSRSSMLDYRAHFVRVILSEDQLLTEPFSLPHVQQPYGFVLVQDTSGKRKLVYLSKSDYLRVADGEGRGLWQSREKFGGTDQFLQVSQAGSRNIGDNEKFFLKAQIRKTGQGTLLIPQHQGSSWFGTSSDYKNGVVVELAWSGVGLEEVSRSPELGGMIAGFTPIQLEPGARREILVAISRPQSGLLQKAGSELVLLKRAN